MNRHSYYNDINNHYVIIYNNFQYYNSLFYKSIFPISYEHFKFGLVDIIHDIQHTLYFGMQFFSDNLLLLIQLQDIKIIDQSQLEKLINNMSILISPMSINLTLFIKNDLTWNIDKKHIQLDVKQYPEIFNKF